MNTYVYVGGLNEEEALAKVKKYYPKYDPLFRREHVYANSREYSNGCVSLRENLYFEHCDESWYINHGYTRLDKEETMDKYYKIVTINTWYCKNVIFRGTSIKLEEMYHSKDRFKKCGTLLVEDMKSVMEITKEEYDKNYIRKVVVELNDKYSAEITETGIKVDCQNFSFVAIENLNKEIKKFLDNK